MEKRRIDVFYLGNKKTLEPVQVIDGEMRIYLDLDTASAELTDSSLEFIRENGVLHATLIIEH